MTHIDFIGIGAPKCGTTWLSAQLEAHPQIGFAPDKEVYFFADTILRRIAGQELRCFDRGVAWYHEQFPALAGAITCRGEFCPAYLYSEEAATRIAAYRSDFKPQLETGKNPARVPRFPILQSGAQRLYAGISAVPGVDKLLKSPAIAKMLQDTYHLLNTKARKYEPLAPKERVKWEAYYAADQEELSGLLRNVQV